MKMKLFVIAASLMMAFSVAAQQGDPEFIGEAYLIKPDGSQIALDKEIGGFVKGISWSHNSANALWLQVPGRNAEVRLSVGSAEPVRLVVRAADNNSDPLTIISIYKLKPGKSKRSVLLSEDNSGTLMKSRTHTESLVPFVGKKFGTSSYLIEIAGLVSGEYGVVVSNPNSIDGKRVVVSCFGADGDQASK